MVDSARKADTRRKIELGGLVIKAGIDELDRVALLGALLLAAEIIQSGDGLLRARKLGASALAGKST